MAGGGYPAWADSGPSAPILVGIAADNVRALTLVQNGQERRIEIKNNAFYTELNFGENAGGRSSIQLRVEYVAGASATIPVGP
jgi:hypothetical protein